MKYIYIYIYIHFYIFQGDFDVLKLQYSKLLFALPLYLALLAATFIIVRKLLNSLLVVE